MNIGLARRLNVMMHRSYLQSSRRKRNGSDQVDMAYAQNEAKRFNYESIDTGYYDRVFQRAKGVQSKWHHTKFAYIRRFISSGQRHLDIGCGPGTFIGTLDEAIRSVGVDIASQQISYARAQYGSASHRFEVMARGCLPFGEAAFDVVTCIELLEHLSENEGEELLAEARRVLKPGGLLVVTTPDYGSLWPVLEWGLNRFGQVSYQDQHITRYTRRRLVSLLGRSEYDQPCCTRFQLFAPFAAVLGWRFADVVARVEPGSLSTRFGFLLLASGVNKQ